MNEENEIFKQLGKLIKEENDKQLGAFKVILKEETTEIKKEIYEIKTAITESERRIKLLQDSNCILQKKNEYLERKLKKNNIVIFGLEVEKENLVNDVIRHLSELLHINIDISQINNVYKIGKQPTNQPIVVEFLSYLVKVEVLKNCKNLKGTKISISDDLSKADQAVRKCLLKHQKEAKNNNLNAYIRGNKLMINNDVYTVEDLEKENTITNLNNENDHEPTITEELVLEKGKASSAPATPANFLNLDSDDDKYDTLEDTEQEGVDIENRRDTKKRKINKHNLRPITRKITKQIPNKK